MANILIVDDREDILKSYKLGLTDAKLGWNIFTAKNENEAETVVKEKPIDVVITDLVMLTEHSGIDVLRFVKEKEPLTMVIIVTAFDKKLDRYEAFELGAFDCIARNTPGVKTIDEIIVKTKTALQFKELAITEIENQRKVTFMKRYFDPKVFGIIEEKPDLLNIGIRNVTIVFWDIRGFSRLCESLKEHSTLISDFLKEYFQVSSEVIFKHGGVLDKFIGDGVMALFGAFNSKENHGKNDAANAVMSAIEIKKRFKKILDKWMEEWQLYTPHKIDIGLGIGIHSGEALVGNVGTEIRDQFTALGSHVNFAQRIESRAGKGQILVSTTTKARISRKFSLKKIETINDVKNIPGEFDIFKVIKSKK